MLLTSQFLSRANDKLSLSKMTFHIKWCAYFLWNNSTVPHHYYMNLITMNRRKGKGIKVGKLINRDFIRLYLEFAFPFTFTLPSPFTSNQNSLAFAACQQVTIIRNQYSHAHAITSWSYPKAQSFKHRFIVGIILNSASVVLRLSWVCGAIRSLLTDAGHNLSDVFALVLRLHLLAFKLTQ